MADLPENIELFNRLLGELNSLLADRLGLSEQDISNLQEEIQIERDANAQRKAVEESLKKQKEALDKSVAGFKQLYGALIDTSTNLTKYSNATNSMIDAIGSLASSRFPAFQMAIDGAVKATQIMSDKVLKQTENMVKAFDEMAQMGGSVGLTAESLTQLGKQAGFTSHNLEIFVKNARQAGSALVALGGSTSLGVEAFSKFTAIGDDQLRKYRRLGLTQEQLIEMQTKYMEQQAKTGGAMARTPEELKKASLGFIDNLLILAELTGKDVKTQQEAFAAAQAQENYNAFKFNQQVKRDDLLAKAEELKLRDPKAAERLRTEAAQIDQMLKAKDTLVTYAQANMSAKNALGVMELAANENAGVFTQNSAQFQTMGFDIQKFMEQANKNQLDMDQFRNEYNRAVRQATKDFGQAAYAFGVGSKSFQEVTGLDNKAREHSAEISQAEAKGRNMAAAEAALAAKKEQEASQDKVMALQAETEQLQRFTRRLEDAVVEAVNPFRTDVYKAALAAAALATAATLAGQMLSRLPGSLPPGAGQGGGVGAGAETGSRTGDGAGGGRLGRGLMRGAGIGAVLGIGSEFAADALGRDTAAGMGATTFGAAATGASLGAIFGPAGAAAGALLGTGVGLWRAFGHRREAAGQAGTGEAAPPGSSSKLLDFIGQLEARGNYNVVYGGQEKTNPPLTEMTVREVLQFQEALLGSGSKSSAVGKYQFLKKTLNDLVIEGKVGLDTVFSPATQDSLATALLERRGLSKFKSGALTADQFANNVAMEWASLPMPNGKSYYEGDGLNKSLVSREEYLTALQARDGGIASGPYSGYPATLHGNEMIQPLDPNSILEALATTPVGQESAKLLNTALGAEASTAQMMNVQASMIEVLSNKLDNVINQLEISNGIQDKLYKYTSS